jgi:hypothetical protein
VNRNKITTSAALFVCLGLFGIVRPPAVGRAIGGEGCGGPVGVSSLSEIALPGNGSRSSALMSEPTLDSVSTTQGNVYATSYWLQAKAFDWNSCIDPFFGQCVEQWGSFPAECNGSLLAWNGQASEVSGLTWSQAGGTYANLDPVGYPETLVVSMQLARFQRFFRGKRCKELSNTRVSKNGGSSCYGGKWNSYSFTFSKYNSASTYDCNIESPSASNVALTYDTANLVLNGSHTFSHGTGATTERSVQAEIDLADDTDGTNSSVLASGTQDSDLSISYSAAYSTKYLRYCAKTSFEAEKPYQYFTSYYPTLANAYKEDFIPDALDALDQTLWTQTATVWADSSVCSDWQSFTSPPVAANLAISYGSGDTATGSYTYSNYDGRAESGTTFLWYFGKPAHPECATTVTTQSATVPMINQTSGSACGEAKFCVLPHDTAIAGAMTCTTWTELGHPSVASVSHTFQSVSGGSLTAAGSYSGWSDVLSGTSDLGGTLAWKLASDSTGSDAVAISGETSSTHTLAITDEGRYLEFCVTPTNNLTAKGAEVCSTGVWIGPRSLGASSTLSGAVLTGSYSFVANESVASEGTSQFAWLRGSDSAGSDASAISGATSQTYTIVSADAGKYLFFCVVPVDTGGVPGTQMCATGGTYVGLGPSITNVTTVTGAGVVTLSYTYSDPLGLPDASATQWWVDAGSSNWRAGTTKTYTPVTADVGHYINAWIVPSNGYLTGSLVESATSFYYAGPTASNVTISQGASSYTGSYTFSDPLGAAQTGAAFAWYRSNTSAFSGSTLISSATTATYTASSSDQGKYLFFCVTASNASATGARTCTSTATLVGPTASNVSQSASVCSVTGNYTFSDLTGASESGSTFAWKRSSSNSASAASTISGATSTSYAGTSSDNGMYLFFCVTPKSTTGTGGQTCASSGTQLAPSASNVSIAQSTSTLTGSYTFASCGAAADQTPSANLVWWTSKTASWSSSTLTNKGTGSTHAGLGDYPYVAYCVTPSDGTVTGAKVCSGWFNWLPFISSATITASGSSLTGSYGYTEYDGGSSVSTRQWYRSTTSSSTGTAISGATGDHYTAGSQDDGKYLSYCVTPVDAYGMTGTVVCAQYSAFPTASSVAISGTAQTGQTLTGSYTWSNASGYSESGTQLQWKRLQQGSWANVQSATSATFTASVPDATTQLEFCVTPSDGRVSGSQVCSSPISIAPTITLYTATNYGGTASTFAYSNGGCINLSGAANNSAMSLKWFGVPSGTTTLKIFDGANCGGASATYTTSANSSGAQTPLSSMNGVTSSVRVSW